MIWSLFTNDMRPLCLKNPLTSIVTTRYNEHVSTIQLYRKLRINRKVAINLENLTKGSLYFRTVH